MRIKVGHSPFKKNCFKWKPFKNDERAFYIILKALSVLKISKFLSRIFGHVGKKACLER